MLDMTLAQYLKAAGKNYDDFASEVGSTSWAVGKWCRGERIPRPEQMARIREATGGAVTADDFYSSSGAAA